ncbi:subtilisin-like protein [Lactarius sanguifluus]|nr:subtilisin-like protein [Lactarius sanguifluus]
MHGTLSLKNWESLGHPSNQTTIDLHLALKSHREDALVEALYEVSDPEHLRYGAHLSKEQVAEVVAPHPDTFDLISSWLEHYDIPSSSTSMTLGGNWLRVIDVSVSQANRILGASYQLYQHVETNDKVLRTMSYSLPEALHAWAYTNYCPDDLLRLSAHGGNEAADALSRREEGVTPSYLRSLYKTSGYAPKATDRNALGIAGYGGQFPSPQDLTLFMNEFRTDGEDATFTVTQINGGGYDPANPSIEANLDIQYAEAMAYPTRHIYYSTGGTPYSVDDPYLCWLLYVIAQDDVDIPRTISTSYGGYEQIMPPGYMMSLCNLFGQLGLRGSSSGELSVQFLPIFPATCPWVTSVGGTTGHDPEVAASISGGSFSIYFPRQPYQANAISAFLQNFGDKYSGLYNPLGRGFPDVSSQAIKLVHVLGREIRFCFRHEWLCTTVAGIISLLNDYLISKGSSPLGFLNPWLYGTGLPGLNDIVSGSNPGCNTDGFPAVAGWFPVTGLGTLDFTKLEEIIDDRLRTSGTPSRRNQRST